MARVQALKHLKYLFGILAVETDSIVRNCNEMIYDTIILYAVGRILAVVEHAATNLYLWLNSFAGKLQPIADKVEKKLVHLLTI